jgi:cob(I)alamin adenosyltransferase
LKIYTKTGDDGTTGLLGGGRVSKASARIEAIGETDELNAAIGVCRLYSAGSSLDPTLERTQNWLFDVGAELASPPEGRIRVESLSEVASRKLEQSIDEQTLQLPPLRAFILPGGSPLAAQLHLARAVCRRAERAILRLHDLETVRQDVRTFMNRLSDWLFVSARTANAEAGVADVEWRKSEEGKDA